MPDILHQISKHSEIPEVPNLAANDQNHGNRAYNSEDEDYEQSSEAMSPSEKNWVLGKTANKWEGMVSVVSSNIVD